MFKLYTRDNEFIEETNNFPSNFTGISEWTFTGVKIWWIDGKRHRLDGPAYEHPSGIKSWHVDNKEVTEKQYKLLHSIMKLKGLI